MQHVAVTLSNGQGMQLADPSTLAGLGQGQPVSIASADLDADGFDDLVVGYRTPTGGFISIHRGNIDAFAPQSDASFQAIAHSQFPSPFLLEAKTFSTPISPDFIALGNFTGSGNKDLAVAAKGGSTLYIFPNDGKGNFSNPQVISLGAGVTALTTSEIGKLQSKTLLVGLSSGGNKDSLVLLGASQQGFVALGQFSLPASVSSIAVGDLDGDSLQDAAVLAGGQIFLLHGASGKLQPLSLPVSASSMALGSFIFDRDSREQIAILTSSGTIQIAAHATFDPRVFSKDEIMAMRMATVNGQPNPVVPAAIADEPWRIVESFSGVAPATGQAPLLLRTRISGNSADDVMVLNGAAQQLAVISHPNLPEGGGTFLSGQVSLRPYSGSPVAALPLRINVDGRPGVMAVHKGEIAPSMLLPLPDPIFNVDTTSDIINTGATPCASATPGQCSLRQAIFEANAAAGVDTIMVPAGTYTLTIADGATDLHNATTGELSITDGVNVIGAVDGSGNPAAIVEACSVNPGSAVGSTCAGAGGTGITEKPFSVNPNFNKAFDTSFSNLEIRFGHNTGTFATDGFGGGFDWEASHTGTMTVTNCNIHDNAIEDGRGAGITATNTGGGTGNFTMSKSTVSNNVAQRKGANSGSGGGIFFGSATQFTITNSHIDNNQAVNGADPEGAGIFIFNPGTTPISVIHGGSISGNGNSALIRGGGIRTTAGITIDQDAVISNNTAQEGAGLWTNLATSATFPSGETTTLTTLTVTGNSASGTGGASPGGGGGIKVDNSASGNFFVMSFSRLAGNTATAGGSNLFTTTPGGAVTATNNWWGTNAASSSIGGGATVSCPAPGAGQVCFDPFIVLSNIPNPGTINLGDTATLTASFLQDDKGNTFTASQISVLLGLQISFVAETPVHGTISNAQGTIQPVSIATTTESGSTVTITTAFAHGYNPGDTVTIAGVVVAGYNGTFTIASTPSTTTFTYTNANTGLADSSGGTATVGTAGTATASFTGTIGGTPAVATHADATVDNGTGIATINVVAIPPSISKSFNPTQIPLNGTTTLTFTITNANAGAALTGVGFIDTLPTGLTVASSTTTVCGGTLTTTNPTGISLASATVSASGTCQFSVTVTGAVAGQYTNTTGAVTSTNAGTGNTATASLTVVAPPSIAKAFNPNSIALNTTTSLTFTITNPNTTVSLTGVGFTDTLPTGLTVGSSTSTVCGGTLTTTSPTGISLSGATIAASGQCQFSVTVTGATAGAYTNTTGAVTSNEGGTGNTATANLTVIAPPSIAKAFNPTQIAQNATTSLTFTITNPNTTVALTGVGFTDTLPTGLTVANGTTTVCGGTLTTTSPTGISLSGATVAAGAQCQFSVTVTGATAGAYTNTTGAVSSTNGGTGNTATANLSVIAPPSIAKVFNPTTIAQGTTTSLTFTITNPSPNTIPLTGVSFTDTLPTGLTVANSTTTVCGGTLTTTSPTGISLTGATIAASGTCQFSVTVTGATAGQYTNTTGAVTSNEGGTGNTATANLTVVAPPSIAKVFNPTSITLNATTSLQFTITNPNTGNSLTGVGFTDILPTGLTVASSTTTVCGGTLTTTAPTGIALTGATIAASGTCQFSVTVTGTTAGSFTNTTGAVTSTNGGTGNTATASLTVVAAPSIAKVFTPTTIALNATTSLTFTITNPAANTLALAGVAFTDTLPTGLTVASGTTTVCGGTLTTTNPTGISLAGATVAIGGTCQFSVTVTGAASGQYTNTTGPVSSTNGGTGNTATANLTVANPPSITKLFNPISIPLNGTSTLSFSITNPNTGLALSGVAFTDSLPSGVQVAATPNVTGSCGSGMITATANTGIVSLSGGTLAAGSSCSFSVNVTGTTAGVKNNSVQVTSTEGGTGNTSNATLTVTQASTATAVTSSLNPSVFGQSVTFTATVTNTSGGSTGAPTGSVQFVVDGVNFGSPVALTGASSTSSTATSQATATLSVAGSQHTVSASYTNADGNFSNSSGSLTPGQTVTAAITATAVNSSANPSVFGQSVTFTATVVDTSAGSTAQPTGSVQFIVDGAPFGPAVTLTGASSNSSTATSQATATLSISGSPHSVTANYTNADQNFINSSGSLSPSQVVTQATTTTTVTSSTGTSTLDDKVTFTATVTVNSPGTGTPTGSVTFFDGSTPIGVGILNNGSPDQATFSTSLLAAGSDSITAIYNGDADFTASPRSSSTTETVSLRGTTTGVVLNPTSVAAGQASTITVTVTDNGASTPPGTQDVFSPTGAPATGRTGFTSTLFADGQVLVAGGTDANNNVLNSAEIYSVSGGTFSSAGNLNTARTGAVAVLLPNGKVLIAGGSSSATSIVALNSAELFDPVAGTFTNTSHNMTAARFGHTATLLGNGQVLITGGQNSGVLNSAELYDPPTDTFTATGNLNTARTGASATLLGNGQVLIAGGSSDGTAVVALNTAELFDPTGNSNAGTFTAITSTLSDLRWQPEAALLLSGKVLVAGGQNSINGVLTSADVYDPVANTFTASTHQMNEAHANGSAVALPNGMVLLPGGTTSQTVDLYDGDSDKFNLTGSLQNHLSGSAATLLNNGDVLMVGLTVPPPPPPTVPPASDAELYSPTFNPLGTVRFSSSEPTDVFGAPCVLTPSTNTASTCISTVTPAQVATSPHTITGTYPADAVHSGSSNTASLTVTPTAPPTIAKAFSASNVAQNGTVNVGFTIVNPNPASTLTGISFTDALPAGLVVATPNNLSSNCGGTFTAVPGSSSISLTGGTLRPPGPPPQITRRPGARTQASPSTPPASGECVITLDLLVTGTGTISNTTGPISANESGPGNPSNTASIQVVLAPTANKAFGAATIPVGGTTSLTFNIANPNTATTLDGIALTDLLPSGLAVASPNGLAGSCTTLSPAPVIFAAPASTSINLSALNLGPASSCSFAVNVTGTSGGTKNNTTAPITGTFDDGSGLFRVATGGTASASIVVVAPPSISKAFVPPAIAPGGVSVLTFTITNPAANTVAENGVAFTDALPANLVVATPNGATGNCNGGTLTAVAGSSSISLTGGAIPVAGSCIASVNVTSSVAGTYTNTTGAVSSTNGGTGNTASATLTVANASLSITKTHTGNFPRGSTGNNYTITVSDSASAGPTAGTVTVTDTLPNSNKPMVPTAMTGTGWTCTLNTLTCTRSDSLAPGASYPPITLTVTVPKDIQANVTNSATVSGGGDPNSHTANDPTHIGPPIEVTLAINNVTVNVGGTQFVNFTVDSSPGEGTINFACSGLPFGMTCSFNPPSTNQLSTSVTMGITASAGSGSLLPSTPGRTPPLYAALLPVLGLIGLGGTVVFGRRQRKVVRLRLGLAFGALALLLLLIGCGGGSGPGVPPTPMGTFQVTVTATSATTGDSGSATIAVTVPQ